MSKCEDGGPAFSGAPQGMVTLRDYFAAKAMQGMLSEDAGEYTFTGCAQAAYEMADAMLAERSKP